MLRCKFSVSKMATVDVNCLSFRYPTEYPNQPLVLKITSTNGLTATDARSLSKLLNSASAGHARDGVVAGFSIADACQEFLLTKNNPEAAKIDKMVCLSYGKEAKIR